MRTTDGQHRINPSARFEHRWTAGVATAAVIAVLAVPAIVSAQREAPAEGPAFEAATVKLAAPDAPAATRKRLMADEPEPAAHLAVLAQTFDGPRSSEELNR